MRKKLILAATLLGVVAAQAAVVGSARASTNHHKGLCQNTSCYGAHQCNYVPGGHCSLFDAGCTTNDCNAE